MSQPASAPPRTKTRGPARTSTPADHAASDSFCLLTVGEVAAMLRVSRSTIYELDRTGALPAVVVARGASRSRRRWRAQDIHAYVESQVEARPRPRRSF